MVGKLVPCEIKPFSGRLLSPTSPTLRLVPAIYLDCKYVTGVESSIFGIRGSRRLSDCLIMIS
jgi:hypothetical protein